MKPIDVAKSRAMLSLLCLLAAGPAFGQQRPSLEALEARIAADEAANCLKADTDGDTYRPLFCPASCSCDIQTPYAGNASCAESAPGDYAVTQPTSYTAYCRGWCENESRCLSAIDCVGIGDGVCDFNRGTCTGGPTGCTEDLDCILASQGTCNFTTPGDCVEAIRPCSSDGDCLSAFTCVEGFCAIGACTVFGSCATGTADETLLTLSDVEAPGSVTVASCDGQPVNSNDATTCVQDIETALGQACAPPS